MNESPDLDAMRQDERAASASPDQDRVAEDQNSTRKITLPPLSALKENDQDAWTELSRQLFPVALAAAKRKMYGEYAEDARDVALKAMNELTFRVAKVKRVEQIPGLLLMLVYQEACNFLRQVLGPERGGGKLCSLEEYMEDHGDDGLAASGSLPVEEAHIWGLADIIQSVAAKLNPKKMKVLLARFYERKSYAEIAQDNDMPVNTVGVYIGRALDEMHEQLLKQRQIYQEVRELLQLPAHVVSLLLGFL